MNIDERLEKAKQISRVLKEFTSEAVQLRVLEYLLAEHHVTEDHSPVKSKSQGSVKKASRKSVKTQASKNDKQEPKKSETKKKSGRPGPGEMINKLIDEGYFSEKRGMNDIIVHCQKMLAYTYKTSDLSPTLARALRSGKLQREQNNEGQYEYIKK